MATALNLVNYAHFLDNCIFISSFLAKKIRKKVKSKSRITQEIEAMLNAKHIFVIGMALLMAVKSAEIADCKPCPTKDADHCKSSPTGTNNCGSKDGNSEVCAPNGDVNKIGDCSSTVTMKPTLMIALFVIALCIGLN